MVYEIKESFKLSDKFLQNYKGKQPDWGPVGYVTYKRSYARPIEKENRTEEFWETLKRVTEGCYSIQKTHCKRHRLPWNEWKAQKSAQTMYDLMWNFKFLPPGRGLWAMGTPIVGLKGSACLNNCAMVSTKDLVYDFSGPFTWLMDMSMFGVGVAFDTEGKDQVQVVEPKYADYTYQVEDSKEGWCEIVGIILDAFVGKGKLPTNIDYSLIRPAGAPIKTFGGTAPGPEVLVRCVDEIKKVLSDRVGGLVTSSDIVDIMNIIGKCVVSGGVRRTAELALGHSTDEDYLKLKDPDINKEQVMAWRWASNNSVFATVGMDYTKLAEQAYKNGEPGFIWLDNIRKYGRIKDGVNNKDINSVGVNPCLTGDTLVATADGRDSVRIDQIEDGTLVYCIDDNGDIAVRPMRHPRITGYKVPVYKVVLDDGSVVRATPNHKFRMRDGKYKELKDLKSGDSLCIITKYLPDNRSESRPDQYKTFSWNSELLAEHVEIAKYKFNVSSLNNIHVHHIDGDKLNNKYENISIENNITHLSNHSDGINNPNSYNISNNELVEHGVKLCKELKRRFSNNEWNKYAKDNNLPSQFSQYRFSSLGTIEEFSNKCSVLSGYDLPNLDVRTLRFFRECVDGGYNANISNDVVVVTKVCEICKSEFTIEATRREQCVCSTACSNKIRDYSKNKEGQKKAFDDRREKNRKEQSLVYLDLKFELNREPLKSEWVKECKSRGIKYEISRPSSPFISYDSLKEYASTVNHRVVSINYDGNEDVWNGTVDDYHNFFLGGFSGVTKSGRQKLCYINSTQCGEQTLENYEICNLVETFPSRHETYEEYKKTLKYAYLYAKTVTLVPTHNERTNSVMLRNRRIGLSQSGIIESFQKHGRRTHLKWCDEGYSYINDIDIQYSRWLCIPESIKKTTVKPSGTVSLLPGVLPGIHYPHSLYYKRAIRIGVGNVSLIKALRDAGYRNEDSVYGDNTVVFYFPIKSQNFKKSKKDVTIWEQISNSSEMQYYWSDNCISQTVTVRPEEQDQISDVLECFESKLKTVSFLPLQLDDEKYPQAPYQEISEKEYNKMVSEIKGPIIFEEDLSTHDTDEKFCDGDSCQISFGKSEEKN